MAFHHRHGLFRSDTDRRDIEHCGRGVVAAGREAAAQVKQRLRHLTQRGGNKRIRNIDFDDAVEGERSGIVADFADRGSLHLRNGLQQSPGIGRIAGVDLPDDSSRVVSQQIVFAAIVPFLACVTVQ